MKIQSLFVTLYSLVICLLLSKNAQCQPHDCNGLTLNSGTLAGWSFWEGKRNNGGAVTSFNAVLTPDPDRISIHTVTANEFIYPNQICTENIPWVPPGYPYSLQIGNKYDGSEIEQASYTLLVDSTNAFIQMDLAVFLEYYDDHGPLIQPKFDVKITTVDGTTIPCGFFNVVAGYNIPGFEEQPGHICTSTPRPIQYLPWKPVSIDLTGYIGQEITFNFTSYDCAQGGHFGFGAVAIKCQSLKITSSFFCPGSSNAITLSAPPGFTNYQWNNGATTQEITLQNPTLGQTYWVKFKPFSSLSGNCESYLEFKIPDGHDILPTTVQLCEGASTVLTTNAPAGSTYFWNTNETTASIQVTQPGEYIVTASKNNCALHDTVRVEQVSLPHHSVQVQGTSCAGSSDGSACAVLTNNQQPVHYTWNSGQTTACASALNAGVYTVTVTEDLGVCALTTTISVSEPLPLTSQTILLRTPHCRDWITGQVGVIVNGGTPPYQIQWSNGISGTETEIPDEGWYNVSITDANGCFIVDSMEVSRFRYNIEKIDNPCFEGQQGALTINASGGTLPYQFRWLPNNFGTPNTFTGLFSGIYHIEMKDSLGCVLADSIEITDLQNEVVLQKVLMACSRL